MSFIVACLVVAGALFAVAFFSKRRFGVLGLALVAGVTFSNLWVSDVTPMIARAGVVLVQPPLESVVSVGLILLPALLLLSSGTLYKTLRQRIIGSLAFAVLAIALLLEPLGSALVIDHVGKPVYDFFVQYRAVIITSGMAFAIFDLVLTKSPKHGKESQH
jgi:hypothetical protein